MFFFILFCYTVILYGHTFIVMYISVPTPITCGTRAADLPDTRQLVLCPANCSLWSLSVFGSGVYASISSICGAAIHRYVFHKYEMYLRMYKNLGNTETKKNERNVLVVLKCCVLSVSSPRGIITLSGGPVEVHGLQGRTNYLSSFAHGVQSQSLSQWSSSFTVASE